MCQDLLANTKVGKLQSQKVHLQTWWVSDCHCSLSEMSTLVSGISVPMAPYRRKLSVWRELRYQHSRPNYNYHRVSRNCPGRALSCATPNQLSSPFPLCPRETGLMFLFLDGEVYVLSKISATSHGLTCFVVISDSCFWLLLNSYSLLIFLFHMSPSVSPN